MSPIDQILKFLAEQSNAGVNPLKLFKRCIDDLFMIWTGSIQNLEIFLNEINHIHPTIKFTYSFSCPFTCNISDNIQHDCFCHSSRSRPVQKEDGQMSIFVTIFLSSL